MKVLHVNTSDIQGGAARAAYRLHRSLLKAGIDSQMLVQNKSSDDHTVVGPTTKMQKGLSKIRPILDSLPKQCYQHAPPAPFSSNWLPFSGTLCRINTLQPDIVHLHWICGGMMQIGEIAQIKQPIVWSLHDVWAFTGGCHINGSCENYKQHCGQCEVLNSSRSHDLSQIIFKRKKNSYDRINDRLSIIGLSRWMADCAASSALFKNTEVVNLPNLIDTRAFAPIDKYTARALLNLPQDKSLVLFGAMSATTDPNKGFRILSQALLQLPQQWELVVFGSSQPKTPQNFKQATHYQGHMHDDISLRLLYSAADVMVVPSLQENLSNAIMESLACATPVVAFDVGGNSDMIEHKINGYLAKPFDPQDLAHGVKWVLCSPDTTKKNARNKIISSFESEFLSKKYINLYKQILVRAQ